MTARSTVWERIGIALVLSVLTGATALAQATATSTTLTSSANPSKSGSSVTFTATVAGSDGAVPTGSVTFNDGATALGTAALNIRGAGQAVGGGVSRTCAVTAGGGLKCWGDNLYGRLGDGSGTNQNSPVDVSSLGSGVIGVSAGDDHTCALMATGGVKCWGRNAFGELGDGTAPTDHATPVDVSGLSSGVVAIAAGSLHTCALTTAGGVKCWGSNNSGELGSGNHTEQHVPVDVIGLTSDVVAIAAGAFSTCAITADGTLKCWGDNTFGQLGTGDTTSQSTPVDILTGVVAVSIGHDHTCAVMSGGSVKCWGFNTVKQVGDTTTDWRLSPVDVIGLSGTIKAVAAGYSHTCALNDSGTVQCWGSNSFGQFGIGSAELANDVVTSGFSTDATAIAAGNEEVCVRAGDGSLQCAGNNRSGELGIGSLTQAEVHTPVDVVGFGVGMSLGVSKAALTTAALTLGNHSITAAYGSDTLHDASTSPILTQTVTASGKSDQTITFNSIPPLDATVGGATYVPAATASSGLTVSLGAGGACTIASGVVHFNSVGSCTVTADQAGDGDYNPAPQVTVVFAVAQGASSAAISSSRNPSSPGQSVTFQALIASADTSVKPTGSVTFRDGAGTIDTETLSNGTASTTVSSLTIGAHSITAQYAGNANFQGAMSGALTQKVTANIGTEARVNTHAAGSQQSPAVARLAGNSYVVAWQSNGQDRSGNGIYAQRYRANGSKFGAELHVSTTTAGDQSLPAVAGLSDGRFVVVWQSPDGSGFGIYGQIFKATGARSGRQFRVNTRAAGAQTQAKVAALPGGKFVVVWASNGQDGSGLGVYARRYARTGKPAGAEFRVNTTTRGAQSNPAVAGLSNGSFIVSWQGADASGSGIYLQRYGATGRRLGRQTQVNTVTVGNQSLPAIAGLANRGFAIAWQSAQQDGSGLGVYAQCYRANAAKSGGQIHVSTATAGNQAAPSLAAFTDGGFVASWTSAGEDGSGQGIYAQAFSNAGARVNVEFGVNTTTAGNQAQPAEAAFAAGNFVVVWTSADAAQNGIYSQRARVPGTN
jgi:alpha-tubulin suppressor-like RCC1 family protein